MKLSSNASESIFRLLVPATDLTPSDSAFIELCGTRWVLAEFERLSDAPPYTCISYSWGKGRTENIFEDDELISDRTVLALETTIKVFQSSECLSAALAGLFRDEKKVSEQLLIAHKASQAIWVDAFCKPNQQPALEKCLRSWGVIYGGANQVIAVLPTCCAEPLRKIYNREPIELDDLLALESDDWVTRAWIYQEITKSKIMLFVAEGDGSVLVGGPDFLNAILTGTTDYADAQGVARNNLAVQFPKLERMQAMFAEEQLVEFVGRSVYQVMSAMEQRFAVREEDRTYAMIGVVTDETLEPHIGKSMTTAEYFLRVCEEKGDYSFIFSTNPRSEVPGRTWRPTGDRFVPVISGLLASGRGLSGYLKDTHLQMNNMCRMLPGKVNSVVSAIGVFLQKDFPKEILEQLRQKGFTGCGEFLKLEHGYFFPQLSLPRSGNLFVAISHGVVFPQGAPGLLLRSNGSDITQFCDTGVFIGRPPEASESINVG